MKVYTLLFPILLFWSCNSHTDKAKIEFVSKKFPTITLAYLREKIYSDLNEQKTSIVLPPLISNGDSLHLLLFFKDGKPTKLIHTTYEDGGLAVGNGIFYFQNGKLSGHELSVENHTIIEIYYSTDSIWSYTFKDDSLIFTRNTSNKEFYSFSEVKAYLEMAYFMGNFKSMAYSKKIFDITYPAILLTWANVSLYSESSFSAHTIDTIKSNTPVNFLDIINIPDSIGKTQVWFKVSVSKTKVGWIKYDSKNIGINGDESTPVGM